MSPSSVPPHTDPLISGKSFGFYISTIRADLQSSFYLTSAIRQCARVRHRAQDRSPAEDRLDLFGPSRSTPCPDRSHEEEHSKESANKDTGGGRSVALVSVSHKNLRECVRLAASSVSRARSVNGALASLSSDSLRSASTRTCPRFRELYAHHQWRQLVTGRPFATPLHPTY